ncbi:hypothetical protein JMJ56_08775 [Belnapia sp. T18]|uniref:Uncharacterized protein n=1 Tax=Belnapia arida TaxID=2804533 RepID=A0ABS1U096_9PROT|nr:hypothetical protein [Belnapia arida]MBL6078098.1 hypothetical protein [Belnapia arida]
MALAHPAVGLALIDLIPNATPNAEARLRRALEAANFPERCPGTLPVWHGRVDPSMLRTLPKVVAEGFDALPPLGLGGPEGWIGAVQAALARDPAWEVPGRPRAAAPTPSAPDVAEEDEPGLAPRRRRRRWIGGGVVLACCLAAGIALLPAAPAPTPPSPQPLAAAPAPESQPVLAALPPLPAPPAPAPEPEPPAAQNLPPIERVVLPVLRPVEPPPKPAAEPPASEPVVEEPALATPPPAPPPPPPLRQAAAPRPRIDPNCSRALFRFQQGERLTAAEEAFVRTGCATRR